jgi:hypothetical protein
MEQNGLTCVKNYLWHVAGIRSCPLIILHSVIAFIFEIRNTK